MSEITPGVPDHSQPHIDPRHPDLPPTSPGPQVPPYREVTVACVVLGIIVGVIMNAAITYAGLKIGFTIGGSAIAAVLGFGVLRGVLQRRRHLHRPCPVPHRVPTGLEVHRLLAHHPRLRRGCGARHRVHHPAAQADDRY